MADFKADTTATQEVVRRLEQAFTDPKYPKQYLTQLVEKYRTLGSGDLFFDSQDFLSKVASDYVSSRDGVVSSTFTAYHASHPANTKYTQLSMKQLSNDFPSLPIPLLTNAFKKHCRLYIPTGLYVNENLDLDANPPTFEGQPFNPANRQAGNDNLIGQDPHFDKDNVILDNDSFDEYCDAFHTLHQPSSRLPPLPTSLEDPAGNDDPVDVIQLAQNERFTCTECAREVKLSDSIQCSKAHTLCLTCLRRRADESILHQKTTVQCGCKGENDRERCTETIHETMLNKRIPEMIPRLKQYKKVDAYPTDTVQSGICPTCFFPLSGVWGEPNHYTCNNCNLHFHVD